MDRTISPPPCKRRRLNRSADALHLDENITVYSWNVNGISPFVQPFLQPTITSFFKTTGSARPIGDEGSVVPPASLRHVLQRHNWPTFLFLQEVKIKPGDTRTIDAVKEAVRPQEDDPTGFPDYTAHFCLLSDKHNARGFGGKVYGVCSIIRKDFYDAFVDKVRSVDWDSEGRLLITEVKSIAKRPKLALINIYAVNGTDSPYKDPDSGLIVGTRHDRKLRVHALLQAECQRLEADGFGCIIAGDLNIARSKADGFPNLRTHPMQHCVNRADFETRFMTSGSGKKAEQRTESRVDAANAEQAGLAMIDTFRHLHPGKKGYTYYPRTKAFGQSCDRVDMILISQSLVDRLKTAGMHETAAERGPSDHAPLFARLDFSDTT